MTGSPPACTTRFTSTRTTGPARSARPTRPGCATRYPTAAGAAATGVALVCLVGAAGCHVNDPQYFPGNTVLETDGMMGMEVQDTVALRFRAPTSAQQAQLDSMTGQLGYQVPWLRADRVHVELRYTVTNLGDQEGRFSLFVDGATEFTRFDFAAVAGAFAAANEDAPALALIRISNPPILKAGEVFQGTIREDDFLEAALDVDAMGRFMAPFVSVLINRSEVNPVGLDMAPSHLSPPQQWIVPALWEVTPRFSANQPMTCQFLVRVRDDDGRLWEDGANEFMPAPTTFTPVVMP